jgi:hypothetical protein
MAKKIPCFICGILTEVKDERAIAMQLAKKLNKPVMCYAKSEGGSSSGLVYPDQIDVHGNRNNV